MKTHRTHRKGILAAVLVWFLGAVICARADTLVQSFTLTEPFGVSHSNQVVTFDLGQAITPGDCYLLNPSGQEVPYQRLSGGTNGVCK